MAVRRRDRGPTDEAARLAGIWGDMAKGAIAPDRLGPLHWLRSWSVRLLAFVERDDPADRLDGWAYRPDEGAADALATLGIRYPQPIGQIREYLSFVEERYREFLALLPPEGCPACGSTDDFEDIDPRQIDPLFRRDVVGLSDVELRADDWRVRQCFQCDRVTKIRVPSPADARRIEQAGWNAGGAVGSLARIVAVAVKAIDEAEATPQPKAKQRRKVKPSGPTALQRANVAAIIAEYGRTIPDKTVEWHLRDRGQGMRKATRLAILRELKAVGKWAG